MAHLIRSSADFFAATLEGSVFFVDFAGARDPAVSTELTRALRRDDGAGVRSLRCDAHVKDEFCWLHGNGWCFSRLAVIAAERAEQAG
jgi:protein-L-isoaspartate(D-aspartate) O-methyltransferase